MIDAPCKDCPDRELYCHDRCKAYTEWAAKRREVLDAIHWENESISLEIELRERRRRSFRNEGTYKRSTF